MFMFFLLWTRKIMWICHVCRESADCLKEIGSQKSTDWKHLLPCSYCFLLLTDSGAGFNLKVLICEECSCWWTNQATRWTLIDDFFMGFYCLFILMRRAADVTSHSRSSQQVTFGVTFVQLIWMTRSGCQRHTHQWCVFRLFLCLYR